MRALIVASALVLGLGVVAADAGQQTDGTLILAQAGGGGSGGGGSASQPGGGSLQSDRTQPMAGNTGMSHGKKAKKKKSKKRSSNM